MSRIYIELIYVNIYSLLILVFDDEFLYLYLKIQ